MPPRSVDSGERTGVKQCLRPKAVAVSSVSWRVRRAVVGQPFDGMRRLADPESTLDASHHQVAHHLAEITAEVASQPITSRSQASIANNTRTISPLRQASSK